MRVAKVANMEPKNDLPSSELPIFVAGIELKLGQHYELTPVGINLLKSGHHRIHLQLLNSPDLGAAVTGVLESFLENLDFSEDTFSHRHKPASLFRAVSTRSMRFLPDEYKDRLRARLSKAEPVLARRVAKLLIHIYETAVSYPDIRTLLHCYFRSDWLTPDKFTLYVRSRLMDIGTKESFLNEHSSMRDEMKEFAREFEPVVGTAGVSTPLSSEQFAEAMEVLYEKLSNQYRLRIVAYAKEDIKKPA